MLERRMSLLRSYWLRFAWRVGLRRRPETASFGTLCESFVMLCGESSPVDESCFNEGLSRVLNERIPDCLRGTGLRAADGAWSVSIGHGHDASGDTPFMILVLRWYCRYGRTPPLKTIGKGVNWDLHVRRIPVNDPVPSGWSLSRIES